MQRKDLTEYLESLGQETIVLEPEYFDNAIIGITDEGRLIYSYDKLIEAYSNGESCEYEEAVEWVDYNTLRAIPYMGSMAPIVSMPIPVLDE